MADDKLRRTITPVEARAGVRPGTKAQPVKQTTTTTTPSAAATEKRLTQLVQSGNVPVWKAEGHDQQIFALTQAQAVAEAERRGWKGDKLRMTDYVKLSDMDRERLQGQAAALDAKPKPKAEKPARARPEQKLPTWRELMAKGYSKEEALRIASNLKESERLSKKDSYSVSEQQEREQASKEAGEKLATDRGKAEVEAQREYIESRGGAIGVLTDAEASRADRTYTTLKQYELSEGQYDITAALQDKAFTPGELRDMGFSREAISDATERISMSSFPAEVGGKATAKAETRKPDGADPFHGSAAKSGVGPPDMTSVRPSPQTQQAGILSGLLLLPFRNRDGSYNLQRMIESKLVSTFVMKDAGFTDAQIMDAINAAQRASAVKGTQATTGVISAFGGASPTAGAGPSIATVNPNKATPTSKGVKAVAVRNLMLTRYQNKDASYDLQKAIEGGKVSVKNLQTAGFSDAEIMAAINAAIKNTGEKEAREIAAALGTTPSKAKVPESPQEQRVAALAKVMREVNTQMKRDLAAQEGRVRDAIRESEQTSVALPGEKSWYHWPTGKTISDAEYRAITNDGRNSKAEEYSRAASQVRRQAIEAVASLFFLPTRAALPEVSKSDIAPMEYAIGAAQIAAWAAPFVPKGTGALQAGAGAVFGVNTAREWDNMSTGGKTLSVAASALLLAGGAHSLIQPSFKPVKVPLKDGGEAVVWRGLSIRGKPIVGVTKVPPKVSSIAEGWRPITRTETTILGTRKMLAKMGVSEAEITKVLTTVKETGGFQGARSPYEPKSVRVGDVAPQSLTPDELAIVLKRLVENKKSVQMVYGSTTIKPQLAPKLRGWRKLGDIEAQLKPGVTEQQAAKLASDMVKDLNKRTPGKFSVDPADPKRIMVRGHHAVELKLVEPSKLGVETQYSLSRTGEMSWGMKVAEKPITVNYPGVGKLKIMRLSESGVRKADAITRAAGDGTFAPPAHRIKDIADYYVILHTFKGEEVANNWARLYGYDPAALLKQAAKDPPRFGAWEFSPSATGKGAPSVSITLPPDLAKVARSNPSLYKAISTPARSAAVAQSLGLLPYGSAAVRPSQSLAPSPIVATSSRARLESPPASPSAGSTTASTGIATASPSVTTSKGGAPSGSPGGKPEASGGSGTTGGGEDDTLATYGESGAGTDDGFDEVPTKVRRSAAGSTDKRGRDSTGKVQWRQGAYWIMVEPPAVEGEVQKNVQYSRNPFWGVRVVNGSPEQTFARQGTPPREFMYEMGVTRASIHAYEKPHLRYRQTKKGRRRGRVI